MFFFNITNELLTAESETVVKSLACLERCLTFSD